MKITKSQLKQIIKEELEAVVRENYGLEGKMAQGQLRRIGELANMIAAQFDDGSNLEEWVEAKITKSQDYLSSVMNYMRGQSFPKARTVHTVKGDFPELSEAKIPLTLFGKAVQRVVNAVFDDLNRERTGDVAKYVEKQAREFLSHIKDDEPLYLHGPAQELVVITVIKNRVKKKYPLEEVQSAALTQQIAYDKAKEEEKAAASRKAAEERAKTGGKNPYINTLTGEDYTDAVLGTGQGKPVTLKFGGGGAMIANVPVFKFGESLERIIKEEVAQLQKQVKIVVRRSTK